MKKNKIINLFEEGKNNINKEAKYSSLLEKFISPFIKKFDNFEYQEDIFEFAINAWNLGNLKSILHKKEFEDIISLEKENNSSNYPLLKKMTESKVAKFKEHTNFIVDYDVKKTNETIILKVKTEDEETFMLNLITTPDSETPLVSDDFEENFINRSAISLKPLQPFVDWHNSIYPDSKIDASEFDDVNIYLINNTYYDDVEAHLRKKFDNYFMRELEGWHTNKKEWPQRRNYKMFKNWFQINISTAVLDLENTPVSKGDL